jgi:hypothetical protein
MNTMNEGRSSRPVSVPHLVLGIVFAGIAAIWFLGEATGADLPSTAVGFPVVLIGAGVIGLVAIFANSRRRNRTSSASAAPEETTVIEEQP